MAKIRLPKIRLNPDDLKRRALDAVQEAELLGGPGEAKFEHARKHVIQWLDDQLTFGSGPVGIAAEAISDVAIRLIVGPVVEWAWAELFGPREKAA